MRGLWYSIINELKIIKRIPFYSISVTVTFIVGLLFPIIVFCIGSDMFTSISSNVPEGAERACGFDVDYGATKIDLNDTLNKYPEIESITGNARGIKTPLIYLDNKYAFAADMVGLLDNFDVVSDFYFKHGRGFSESEIEEAKDVCIIGTELAKELYAGNYKLIDYVTYKGVNLKVIGIIGNSNNGNRIYVPYGTFYKLHPEEVEDTRYTFILKEGIDYDSEASRITDEIINSYGNSGTVGLPSEAAEFFYEDINNILQGLILIFLVAIVVTIYACINISTIILSKYDAEIQFYRTRMAVGASKKHLYIAGILQMTVLILIAAVIDIALVSLIQFFFNAFGGFDIQMSWLVVSLTAALGLIIATVISMITIRRVIRATGIRIGRVKHV
jgi:ABC-type antimicrobial peptide transport system permease subunit